MPQQIPLHCKDGTALCAFVDDDDFPELSRYKWYLSYNGYAYRSGTHPKNHIYMHRQVLNAPKGIGVDHINGDKLDNTRQNLRLATQGQNVRNARPWAKKVSRYKGVSWNEQHWRARIQVNHEVITLGYFPTQREAAFAYNEAAKRYFGEFAWLNEIVDDPDDLPVQKPSVQPSRFRGVTWDYRRQKWMAKLKANGKFVNIGRFADEVEAAQAYDAAARIHFGQKAKLNFP